MIFCCSLISKIKIFILDISVVEDYKKIKRLNFNEHKIKIKSVGITLFTIFVYENLFQNERTSAEKKQKREFRIDIKLKIHIRVPHIYGAICIVGHTMKQKRMRRNSKNCFPSLSVQL